MRASTRSIDVSREADALVTVAEAAEWLGVKVSWVADAVRRRELPHVRVGKHVRIRPEDLRAYVEENRHA